MCGIIGYVGKKDVVPLLIEGLKRLEYRGYDSAGVAVQTDGELKVEKVIGKIAARPRAQVLEQLQRLTSVTVASSRVEVRAALGGLVPEMRDPVENVNINVRTEETQPPVLH